MREPFETLLGHLHDHWSLGNYLQGAVPDWEGILVEPRWSNLSSGEAALVMIALAIYNGDQTATIADLMRLDVENRHRALAALEMWCQAAPR